MTNSLSC